jgi:helicase
MCGRAGRPQYDEYGEAVLVAHGKSEARELFDEFILAEPERITSKLASEPALRTHVLASIAAGYVRDEDSMIDFMKNTFFAYQYGVRDVRGVIERVLDFLEREDMVRWENKLLLATPFGERVSKLYVDPLSAVILRDGLRGVISAEPTGLGLLHLVCSTPDMGILYLRRHEYEEMENVYLKHADELLTPIPDPERDPEKFEGLLAELKTARMLQMWIEEMREEDIHERFGIGAGDIRRKAETAEWLLYAAHELASLLKVRRALTPLRKLHNRVRYGVKEELLELVQLRGVGRVRARSLFRAGYRKLADLERASEQELAGVPYIGPETAKNIKRQLE